MSFGVVMLVHDRFDRAEQLARHWVAGGCPVVIHVDRQVPGDQYDRFHAALTDEPRVSFSQRHRCEWGTWGLVAGTQAAAEQMLARHPDVSHVYLVSGACLPLRPVEDLALYLEQHPDTDFIESVSVMDATWARDGLEKERFTLRFPFAWRRQRRLFDHYVKLQRRCGVRRKIPKGIEPHMGSQWWCLTRDTLSAILSDPSRRAFDSYFRWSWIPDESYFQSLARRHTRNIESRSLTLAKFDNQGKPYVFYDDHLQLLRRSDCFVARKIWSDANLLFDTFLGGQGNDVSAIEPNPRHIDRVFERATDQRLHGRTGLYMGSRFPHDYWLQRVSAAPYTVFEGFDDLFEDFQNWLTRLSSYRVHGHLFAKTGAEFAGGDTCAAGALSDSAPLRDYEPRAFLRSLIWNSRRDHQCFMFGPQDVQAISAKLASDPDARIFVISGAWALPIARSGRSFTQRRAEAARLQRIEADHISQLRAGYARARVDIWTLADVLESPEDTLGALVREVSPHQQPQPLPPMKDLTGLAEFVERLRNGGMNPHLIGDVSVGLAPAASRPSSPRRPYLVK